MEYVNKIAHVKGEDRNCCALNATALTMDIPYYDVYKVYKAFGRIHGRGCSTLMMSCSINWLMNAEKDYNIDNEDDVIKVRGNWRMPTYLNMTLEKFAKQYPKGRYIVVKSNHALALIDGVWYDNHEPNPRARVKHFYRIA